MSSIGPPHPYDDDIYSLHLSCNDRTTYENYSFREEERFLNVETGLDPETASCRVESYYLGMRQLLFDSPLKHVSHDASVGEQVPFTFDATLDAYRKGDEVVVDPSRRVSLAGSPETYLDTQGRMVLTPAARVPWHANEMLGLEFEADGELALGVTVVSHGREFFRYYPRSSAGSHSLILLNPLGFEHGEDIFDVERVVVYFYTDRQEQIVSLMPKRILLFHDQYELYEYFRQVSSKTTLSLASESAQAIFGEHRQRAASSVELQ
jgi:hypothetical protein